MAAAVLKPGSSMGWFDDNEDFYMFQCSRSPDRSQLCRNGRDCKFAARGACWFKHPEGQTERPKKEKQVFNFRIDKWEDWSQVNLEHRLRRSTWPYEGFEENWVFGEDYDEEVSSQFSVLSSDEEDSEEDLEESELENDFDEEKEDKCCKCSQEETITDPLLDNILDLPPELQVKVFQKLELCSLLCLELSSDMLREVLRVPREQNLEMWLGREVARQDLGIIYIPRASTFYLSNDEEYNDGDEEDVPLHFEKLSPGLEPGFYKVRQLFGGFDLVRLDHHFLTSLCGPRTCSPPSNSSKSWAKERVGNWAWACSYRERGFVVNTEQRDDLVPWGWRKSKLKHKKDDHHCHYGRSYSEYCFCTSSEDESDEINKAESTEEFEFLMTGSGFIISLEDGWWRRGWMIQESKSYCRDDVGTVLKEEQEEESRLSVILCQEGGLSRVVAYILSNDSWQDGGFHSFDPNESSMLDSDALLDQELNLGNFQQLKKLQKFSIIR